MKIKQVLITLTLIVGMIFLFVGPVAYAEKCNPGASNEYETLILPCSSGGEDGIMGLLNLVIIIMSSGIGLVGVGGIIYGSILYTSAGDSVEQTRKAKHIILNVAVGLAAYAMMFSFLEFLIPGGIFN